MGREGLEFLLIVSSITEIDEGHGLVMGIKPQRRQKFR